jgi:hypothetical protein
MQKAGMPWCAVRCLDQVIQDISGRRFGLDLSLEHRVDATNTKATYFLLHVYDSQIPTSAYRRGNKPRESWRGRNWGKVDLCAYPTAERGCVVDLIYSSLCAGNVAC